MVAVGIWSVQLGGRATWLLPVVFPAVMALGGTLGLAGFHLSGIEVGIACSALFLGAMVSAEFRAKLPVAAVLVAVFALFHGYAHGAEVPPGQSGSFYSVGFILSTVSLNGLGILFGLSMSQSLVGTSRGDVRRDGAMHGRRSAPSLPGPWPRFAPFPWWFSLSTRGPKARTALRLAGATISLMGAIFLLDALR